MNKRKNLVRLAVLAAVGFSAVYPACADTNGWTTITQPIYPGTTVINGCAAGDAVQLTGTIQVWIHTRVQNGTTLVREIDLIGGTGVGTPSGAKYVFGEAGKINTSLGPNPDGTPFSYTERRVQILAGIGVPDQIITYNIRLVIDANGNVTTDVFDFGIACH